MSASLGRVGVPRGGACSGHPEAHSALEARVAEAARGVEWEAALPARAKSVGWVCRRVLKRILDISVATLALLLLSPVFLVVAALVGLDGGPVFYRWCVLGLRGRPFTGYKFRTMVVNADQLKDELKPLNEMSGPVFKIRKDPRVTRLGRFLRRHSIDELPQIWSVLKGDMSLVGPRPMFPEEFIKANPVQRRKLAVVPGLTCLWQVSGRADIRDFGQWCALDLQYIRDWSLRLDLAIIVRTVAVVFRGSGAY